MFIDVIKKRITNPVYQGSFKLLIKDPLGSSSGGEDFDQIIMQHFMRDQYTYTQDPIILAICFQYLSIVHRSKI